MASILNKLAALIALGNTGMPKSVHNPGLQTGGLLVPRGWTIPYAESDTPAKVLAWLKTQMYAPRGQRIFIIGRWEQVDKKGTDRQQQNFNSGGVRTIRRGKIGHDFTVINGGKWYHTKLMAFDGRFDEFDYLPFDDKGFLIGVTKTDNDGNKVLGGRSLMDFFVGDWQDEDGTAGNQFMVSVQYADSAQINIDYGFMNLGTSLFSALEGLNDIELYDAGSVVANELHIGGTMDNGQTDLYDYYGALLAAGAAWSVVDPATGLDVTITSVIGDAANKFWKVLLASGIGSNNPGTGDPVLVSLVPPVDLAALAPDPVFGIESNEIEVDVP